MHAIRYAVRFYGKCARWAARGTIERANAWFWPIGIPFLAFIGWWWGFGVLKFPSTWSDFFPFMIATVTAAWVVFFVVRFAGAAPHFHKELQDEIKQRDAQEAKKFEFVFDPSDQRFVRRMQQQTRYFFGLHILAKETIDYPNVWALDSEFTKITFAQRSMSAHHPSGAVAIYKGGAIDPGHTEIIELYDLPNDKKFINARSPLHAAYRFTLQARGRNCKPVDQEFEYNPDKTPMIRMLK
jgi:hypothetical protein